MNGNKSILPFINARKSLTLIRLAGDDGSLKQALRLRDKKDYGIIFPFSRSYDETITGIKTILGVQYGEKVFHYWIPKAVKIHEPVWNKRTVLYQEKDVPDIGISTKLPRLMDKDVRFIRMNTKNTVFDFSSLLNTIFPSFDDKDAWNKYSMKIDDFIVEWLRYTLVDETAMGKVIKPELTRIGGSVTKTHKNVVLGINISTLDNSMVRFLDPTLVVTKTYKSNMSEYIQILMIRAITAHHLGIKDDQVLNDIYNIISKCGIVFVNKSGIGFFYNTNEDPSLNEIKGASFISKVKNLYRVLVAKNDPNNKEVFDELTIVDSESSTKPEMKLSTPNSEIQDTGLRTMSNTMAQDPKLRKLTNRLVNRILNDDEVSVADIISEELPIDEQDTEIHVDQSGDEPTLDNILDPIDKPEEVIDEDYEDGVDEFVKNLAPRAKRTVYQEKRAYLIAQKYKTISIDNRTLEDILEDNKSTVIETTPINVNVRDKSISESRLVDFERSYIDKTMDRDIVSTLKSFSNDDMSIKLHINSLKKEDTSDQSTSKITYRIELKDENNKTHTINLDIPKTDSDGFLYIGGNKKLLKKQFINFPIVKYSPSEVMITTNYNKCIVYRSGSVISSSVAALLKFMNSTLNHCPKFRGYYGVNTKTNNDYVTTMEYDTIGTTYHKIVIGNEKSTDRIEYYFGQDDINIKIEEMVMKYTPKEDRLPIGINFQSRQVIDIDINTGSVCEEIVKSMEEKNIFPDIRETLHKFNKPKRRMHTKCLVMNNHITLVSLLGCLFGIDKLIRMMGVKYTLSESKLRDETRVFVKFKDTFFYFDDNDMANALILNGLSYMKPEDYNFSEFNSERPYVDYFLDNTGSRQVLKGFTSFRELFLDNITLGILRDNNLPTGFLEVFLYANNLLTDNNCSSETSMDNYRIRNYEIIPVLMYKVIAQEYRLLKQSNLSNGRMRIQQDAVITALNHSFLLENIDTTSPISELKNKSTITFKGPNGLNSDRAYTLKKRSYDPSSLGVVAISSVESGSVGINKELVINPNIDSTRGYIKSYKGGHVDRKLGNLASSSEAMVPFTNWHDSSKRIGMTSSQSKHIIKVSGGNVPVISTGFDKTLPYMIGNTFVPKAYKDGVVTKLDHKTGTIVVKYNDGTSESFDVGNNVVRNSSFFFENSYNVKVKEGQKVKAGEILAYEKSFFKEDAFGNVRDTSSTLCKIAVVERSTTDDDSMCLTEKFSKKLTTKTVNRKQISISKYFNVVSFKKIGDVVKKGDPLLVFEDSGDSHVNSVLKSLGDANVDILKMARKIPKSPVSGEIVGIKVYYTCPLDELDESVADLVDYYHKIIKQKIKNEESQGERSNLRVMLQKAEPTRDRINGAVIDTGGGVLVEYFIAHNVGMGVGDKCTTHSSVKSIISRVIPANEEPVTEDGVVLDGIMSEFSLANRIVMSPFMSGVMCHCLVESTKNIAKKFLESVKK